MRTRMNPEEAARILRDVIPARKAGYSWEMIACGLGYENGKLAKKAAHQAAGITQAWMLQQKSGEDG